MSSRAPHPQALGLRCNVTEAMIGTLVTTFYARVRADQVLGPIFERHIDDWDAHLTKLCAFWSSVMLMTGRYKGRPMPVHAALPGIEAQHFERWLGLFREAARDCCPPDAAAAFIDRSERIAQSLKLGMALQRQDGFEETRP